MTTSAPAGLRAALAEPGAGGLLRTALAACYGRTGRGRLDVAAAAAGLDVSPRTVQRWLHGHPTRATVPARRLDDVLAAIGPSERTRTRERLDVDHAEQGLRRLRLGRRKGNLAQYAGTGWLQPHTVAVLELPGSGLRRVAVSRDDARTTARMRRGVDQVDAVTVPNRFAATLVRRALLSHVDPWRVEAAPGVLPKGHTQTWLAPADLPALSTLSWKPATSARTIGRKSAAT